MKREGSHASGTSRGRSNFESQRPDCEIDRSSNVVVESLELPGPSITVICMRVLPMGTSGSLISFRHDLWLRPSEDEKDGRVTALIPTGFGVKDFNNKTVKTDQVTIFYAGSVHVFDDFPVDKMKEVMSYAANSSPNHISSHFVIDGGGSNKTGHVKLMASAQNVTVGARLSPYQELLQAKTESAASDLPIARRASLHRFLSKRKDRALARAPYIRNSPTEGASTIHGPRSGFFREP